MALTQPTFSVQMAFGNNPLDAAPTWTTLTAGDVKSVHIKRGRQHELSRFQTGVCTLELDNRTGNYDPNNTSGVYFPNVKIFVPVRVVAAWPVTGGGTYGSGTYGSGTYGGSSGSTYTIFQGFVESWPQKYASITDSDVTVTCVDAFKLLNLALLTTTPYARAVIADGAVAYYRLNETVATGAFADSSGHGNAASTTATWGSFSNSSWVYGVAGALLGDTDSAVFAGTASSNAQIPTSVTYGTSGYSIEMWYKPTATSGTAGDLFWSDPTQQDFATPLYFHTRDVGGAHNFAIMVPLTADVWHHLVFVRDTTSTNIYVDGVFASTTPSGAIPSGLAGGTFLIGGTVGSQGGLDEYAIYTTPLTATQVLNHYQYGLQEFATQLSGARVGAVLDLIGWPTAQRALDTGRSQVQGATSSLRTTSALAYLQTVETSENGSLFVSADGKVTFYDRYKLQSAPFNTSQVTMGDGAGEEPYESGPDITYDDLDVYNDITAQRAGGVAQRVTDTASTTAYGTRSRSLTGLLNVTDLEVADRAGFELTRYKTPKSRIAAVHVHPMDDPGTLFPKVLGLDLLSRITVKRRPLGYTTFNQDSFIEGIEHTITPDDWHTIWSTVPVSGAGYATTYFTLDDTTLGVLDTNALGY